ncbi:MAG: hypothetical protein DHS20C14_21000 [Phycisphaeraceae bacterium]|nr:MAG: hypothetical protein DHS20C14_21000 [Phycisphaeraceae bacterium]
MKTLPKLLLAALALVLAGALASAAPEPDPVPTRWQLDVEVGDLRIALVETERGTQRYFFLTYTITNHWGNDLLFFPDLQLKTDEATVQRSGRDVPSAVQDEIIRRLDSPYVEDQIAIVGQVLQGPENARTGVAIWPALDLDVDEVMIFFAGLSGENKSYYVADPENPDARQRINLRKTLMLRFDTPGEFGQRNHEKLELAEKLWIMR